MAEALTTQEQLVRVSVRIFPKCSKCLSCVHMSASVSSVTGDFFCIFFLGGSSWEICRVVNSSGPFAPSQVY